MSTIQMIKAWEARFYCDFHTAVTLVRGFSARLQDGRIRPAAFGFGGDYLKLEEKRGANDAIFSLELHGRVQGRHTIGKLRSW